MSEARATPNGTQHLLEPVYAELVAVGDELLAGDIVNTNAAYLGQRCRALGIVVRRDQVIRDRVEEIARAIEEASRGSEVCLVCGGLGPTTDDLTARAVARAAGVPLRRDASAVNRLRDKFAAIGRPMPEANLKQADFPAGADILANPMGSAEGFMIRVGSCRVFAMPGVPTEMRRMMLEQVEPRLRADLPVQIIPRRLYRVLGMGESSIAERIAGIIEAARSRSDGLAAMFVHYRASTPEVSIIFEATPSEAAREVVATEDELRALDAPLHGALAPALYGIGEAPLAARLVAGLRAAGLRLGTAESCTGGGAAAMVAAIPGASDCFDGGIVAYDNRIKTGLLGVPAALLAEHGAVSEPVARAMAENARAALGSDLSIGITGIAGPAGGTPEKPLGTVHIAVADPIGTEHMRLQLRGDRGTVQRSAGLWALKLAWDRLLTRNLVQVEEMS